MATTTTHNGANTNTRDEGRSVGRGTRVSGDTEARPGVITTEFWLTIVAAVAVIAISYIDDGFTVDLGWKLGIGVIAAYVISRGIAKAGSSERYVADLRD